MQQVADVTRIVPRVLEALEADDESRLPGGIFSRSFVRSYASHLGLSPDAAVKQFLQQFPDDAPPEQQALAAWQAHEAALSRPQERSVRMVIGAVVAVALVAVGVWYWRQTPSQNTSTTTVTEQKAPPLGTTPDVSGGDTTQQAPPPVGAEPSGETIGRSTVLEAARAIAGPAPAGDPDGAPPPDPALVGPPPPEAAPPPAALPESLEVVIEPVATCWVRLMVDGEFAFARVLRPGEREVRTAVDQVVFDIGDASAFRFSINGVPGRVLGRKGQVVTARISRENVSSYLAQ